MISLKCKVCHGELVFMEDKTMACPYCGNRYALTGGEMDEYGRRRQEILRCLSVDREAGENTRLLDSLWQKALPVRLTSADGRDVAIRCLYEGESGGARLMTARENLLIQFPRGDAEQAERYNAALGLLEFPKTEGHQLTDCFPRAGQVIPLNDGQTLLAVAKQATYFPLAMFGALTPEHAAWVVSRLENICCVLEFSGVRHGRIDAENVLIDPWTHQAALMGGWEGAARGSCRDDLAAMRRMILRVMGANASGAPEQFRKFLRERPAATAYDDFSAWDDVISRGFGGRRFAKMDVASALGH